MKKAIVSYPAAGGKSTNAEASIILNHKDVHEYGKQFPNNYPMLASKFKDLVEEGHPIIINPKGGWCLESDDIKILRYLDKTDDKKKQVEFVLLGFIMKIGMDRPSNFDDILEYVYEDVDETADKENWSVGDVVIGFRRWIEAQG